MKLLFTFLLSILTLSLSAQNKKHNHVGYDFFNNPIIEYKEYSDSGLISQEGKFIKSKPHGIWKMYDSKGNLVSKMKFNYGDKVWLKKKNKGKEVIIYYENNSPYKSVAYFE